MHAHSRIATLTRMAPGDRVYFEAPAGRLAALQSQITVDIHRAGLRGLVTLERIIAVAPRTLETTDLVRATRLPNAEARGDEAVRCHEGSYFPHPKREDSGLEAAEDG